MRLSRGRAKLLKPPWSGLWGCGRGDGLLAWQWIAYVNSGPQTPVLADEPIGRLFGRRASRIKVAAGNSSSQARGLVKKSRELKGLKGLNE